MAEDFPTPWIKTMEEHKVRRTSLDYVDKSTYHFVKGWAEKTPNNLVMIFGVKGGKTITYADFFNQMKALAVFLAEKGIKKGDKVAVMLPNSPHYVIAHFAILSQGAIVVQTNPLYTDHELSHIIKDSGAVGMISLAQFQDKINKVIDDGGNELKWAIYGQVPEYMSSLIGFLAVKILKKVEAPKIIPRSSSFGWKEAMAADTSKFKEADIKMDDIALFQYTGGTTGLSKGAMLTHRNVSYNAQQAREAVHMVPESQGSVLTALPLFHSFALTACLGLSQQLGIPMVLVPNPRGQIPTGEVHALIGKHKITFLAAVPTMINSLLNHPAAATTDWNSLIASISGGAALPMELAKQFKEVTGADLVEGYGLSETSPLITVNPVGHDVIKPRMGSIGLPAPDTFIKIVDQNDKTKLMPIGPEGVGEIACKGPQVMPGYYNKPEENEMVLFDDGWFLTGDVAYMDEEGFTYIVDRKKDMIIVSGYNVYPREVEEVLFEHPKIFEAAVAGYADSAKGERVGAWVVLNPGETLTEEEVIEFCKTKLAAYKVPKKVTFRDELPKTMVGKVLRRKLNEEE
ncbi:MAG: long-chain fatty acid--CoA ligase [Candidatus Heimdallarchaeota archaeon]|nr:long-chain fatty acid--CoA ligase [Candidatus Heimdallarchaeota archaeon]